MDVLEINLPLDDQIKLSSLVANMKRAAQHLGSHEPGSLGDKLFCGALKLNLQLRHQNLEVSHVELCTFLINEFNFENAKQRNDQSGMNIIKAVKYNVVSKES